MYLHYVHFQKEWFVLESNSPVEEIRNVNNLKAISDSFGKTKKEIRLLLKEEFPNTILVHTILYREGPSHLHNSKQKLLKVKLSSSVSNSSFSLKRK